MPKKIWITISIVFLVLLCSIYVFIPATLEVGYGIKVNAAMNTAKRVFFDTVDYDKKNSIVPFAKEEKHSLKINNYFYNSLEIILDNRLSQIVLVDYGYDSTRIYWGMKIENTLNPFGRIGNYVKAKTYHAFFKKELNALKLFLEDTKKVYGVDIKRLSTTDTLLISRRMRLSYLPQHNDIMQLVQGLQTYIQQNKGKQTGLPLYHMSNSSEGGYDLMVALPIEKEIPSDAIFKIKKMIPGYFITAEVEGGMDAIEKAYQQTKKYFEDHNKLSMAIDFVVMLTERKTEKDSNQWKSRIYMPVLE